MDEVSGSPRPDWVLPAGLGIPRLEAVIGCRLDELTWDTLQGLIDQGVREDLSLDFKSTLYTSDDKGRFELPKDVAAFANAAGGLIVVGLSDKNGVANGFSKQEPTDAHKRNTMTTLIAGLAPFVPDIHIGIIENPTEPKAGCLLLVVPSSDNAPHAVVQKRPDGRREVHSMSWPMREGSQTRWLTEAELASRYRERFAGRDAVARRLHETAAEGQDRLDVTHSVWLTLAIAPTRPAPRRPLTPALLQEVQALAATAPRTPGPTFSSQPSYGRGRVVLSDQ